MAALGVVLFHACQWSRMDFAVGAAGVDVFFVISGFVLWASVEAGQPSPGTFLKARFVRVTPLYWLVTLTVAALVLWRPKAMSVAQFSPSHLILSLFFIPHNDPAGDAFPLLASGWTLTYEAFFYLALAVALACPKDRRLPVLYGVVATTSMLGLAYPKLYPLLANPLLMEFLAGVGLARLWGACLLQRRDPLWGWAGMVLGGAVLLAQQVGGLRDDLWRPLLWGAPALLMVAGGLALEGSAAWRRGRIGRALERLGDASYAIYLCQLPVICALAWFARDMPALVRAPLAVVLAIGAGLACHRLIEAPIGRAFRILAPGARSELGGGRPRRRAGAGLGVGLGSAE